MATRVYARLFSLGVIKKMSEHYYERMLDHLHDIKQVRDRYEIKINKHLEEFKKAESFDFNQAYMVFNTLKKQEGEEIGRLKDCVNPNYTEHEIQKEFGKVISKIFVKP